MLSNLCIHKLGLLPVSILDTYAEIKALNCCSPTKVSFLRWPSLLIVKKQACAVITPLDPEQNIKVKRQ